MTQPMDHGKTSSASVDTTVVREAVRASVGAQQFQHWFDNRTRLEVSGDCLQIFVANPFLSNWLLKRFRTSLNKAAAVLLGAGGRFEVCVDESLRSAPIAASSEADDSANRPAGPDESTASQEQSTPTKPAATKKVTAPEGVQTLKLPANNRRRFRRFQSLVAGEGNQLALMAAQQVAAGPGERFNPLYIHGTTGVGKTHLLESIYSETRKQHPQLNVMFITSEAFTNYFTQALDARSVPSFRQRFRNVNVLLVDNIEFLDNKRATQEEFLHTMVQVVDHGGQVVLTSDRHPRLLTKHREELTTRFESGMVCRVHSPDEETRIKIARTLALPYSNAFTPEAVDYVARRCRKNVREIQGALNVLQGHFELTKSRITVARARDILGELQSECRRLVRISDVEKVICDVFGLSTRDLRSKSRRKAVSHPRSLAMFVARKLTKSAYREIGAYFGGRDHSTVVAAERRVQEWVEGNTEFELPSTCTGRTVAEIVQELEERIFGLVA